MAFDEFEENLNELDLEFARTYLKMESIEKGEEILRKLIEKGYVPAMYVWGRYLYDHGENTERYLEGSRMIQQAAELGSGDACLDMSVMRYYGRGHLTADAEDAFDWAYKAVCHGTVKGFNNMDAIRERTHIGMTTEQFGLLIKRDKYGESALTTIFEKMAEDAHTEEDRMRWRIYSANIGDTSALGEVGDYYFEQETDETDEIAARYFTKLANAGNSYGEYSLGFCYEVGRGVKKNKRAAFKYYKKAAENVYANTDAMFSLAEMYEEGDVVEQDLEEAAHWREIAEYRDRLRNDDPELLEDIALQHYEEALRLHDIDPEAAFQEYDEASSWEHVPSMMICGDCCRDGYGHEKDLYWAGVYYGYAAEAGNADGMYWKAWTLEQMNQNKECESEFSEDLRLQELKEAEEWYRKAADLGQKDAIQRVAQGFVFRRKKTKERRSIFGRRR